MNTGQKSLVASAGVLLAALGALCFGLRRFAQVCIVDGTPAPTSITSAAERAPALMLMFAVLGVGCFLLGAAAVFLAVTRPASFACPHCGKGVEPRWSLTGALSSRAAK